MKKVFAVILGAAVIIAAVVYFVMPRSIELTLKGKQSMTITTGTTYKEPGYTASYKGKNLTSLVKVSSVDTTTLGTKSIKYTLTYDQKTTSVTRTVKVVDNQAPTLVIGGDQVEWKLGTAFKDLGYRVYDNHDASSKISVKVSNNVDVNKAGTYQEVYKATDTDGNTTTKTRQVIVSSSAKMSSTGIAVCMYHYLYADNNVPSKVNVNYISINTFKKELDYLIGAHYYFPTFSELRDYVDGKINLPQKSIILSFDDGQKYTIKQLSKIALEYKVPITSFLITSHSGKEKVAAYQNAYFRFESHSHNMHHGGGKIGHGGIFTALSVTKGLADLKTSISICGSGEAFAYPFGDTNASSEEAVKEAGFKVAFTTVNGKAKKGADPLLLPRLRMFNKQSLFSFKSRIQ